MGSEPSPITDEMIQAGYDYWLCKRGVRDMPSRVDLDPAEIKRILPSVMLVDVLGPHQYRYRLIGTSCVVAHGINAAGKTLDEALKDYEYRAHVVGLYDQCVAERRPLYSESLFFRSNAAVDRHLKVLFMPLSADAVTVGMVFVVQIIEFIDETIRDRHFISTNRHKEFTRALL